MAKWYGRNGNKTTEGAKNGLKREKPTIKQGSKLIKNERSENSSSHKRSRMSGKMHK